MLEEARRCIAAAATLALAGIWIAAGAVAALGSLLAAVAAYCAVAYLQRHMVLSELQEGVARSRRSLARRRHGRRDLGRARSTARVASGRRAAPARVRLDAGLESDSSSSAGRGYGW